MPRYLFRAKNVETALIITPAAISERHKKRKRLMFSYVKSVKNSFSTRYINPINKPIAIKAATNPKKRLFSRKGFLMNDLLAPISCIVLIRNLFE
jgi:hypothetical protein